MRKKLWLALSFTILAVALMPFTNCDNYSENSPFGDYSSSCIDFPEMDECKGQSAKLLELRINSSKDIYVNLGDITIPISGDCNEAGFPDNVIIWELYIENQRILSSTETSPVSSGRCVDGQFVLQVRVMGLKPAGFSSPVSHRLEVELIAFDSQGHNVKNPILARKTAYLHPSGH